MLTIMGLRLPRPCTHEIGKQRLVTRPLCPQKRTFVRALSTSALCQKQTRSSKDCDSLVTCQTYFTSLRRRPIIATLNA